MKHRITHEVPPQTIYTGVEVARLQEETVELDFAEKYMTYEIKQTLIEGVRFASRNDEHDMFRAIVYISIFSPSLIKELGLPNIDKVAFADSGIGSSLMSGEIKVQGLTGVLMLESYIARFSDKFTLFSLQNRQDYCWVSKNKYGLKTLLKEHLISFWLRSPIERSFLNLSPKDMEEIIENHPKDRIELITEARLLFPAHNFSLTKNEMTDLEIVLSRPWNHSMENFREIITALFALFVSQYNKIQLTDEGSVIFSKNRKAAASAQPFPQTYV